MEPDHFANPDTARRLVESVIYDARTSRCGARQNPLRDGDNRLPRAPVAGPRARRNDSREHPEARPVTDPLLTQAQARSPSMSTLSAAVQ